MEERRNLATEINNQKKLAASKRVPIKTVANSKSKSIKTSSKSKVKNADVGAGSIRPKRSSMVSILNESTIEGTLETKPIFQLTTKKFVTALISVFLLSSTITYGITHKLDSNSPTTTTFLAKISGGVALSESELIDVITQLKRNVYWTGPEKGAKYTVNALTDGQTYIRYLPGRQRPALRRGGPAGRGRPPAAAHQRRRRAGCTGQGSCRCNRNVDECRQRHLAQRVDVCCAYHV